MYVYFFTLEDSGESRGVCDYVLTFLSVLLIICTIPFSLFFTFKVRH